MDRAANKFNEVTTRIDNKIQDAFDYVKRPVDKFLIENESTLQKLAKGLDDTFAPRRAVVASNGKPYTIPESSTKFQDCVSKMAGKAKDNLEKSLSPAERAAKKEFSKIGTTENGGPNFDDDQSKSDECAAFLANSLEEFMNMLIEDDEE